MKFALKNFQTHAVAEVLGHLQDAKEDWRRTRPRLSSLALAAPTGAGKTVMAAAIIEGLFFGNDDLGIVADPTATVLWFTSDPSLNEQTRHRILQASDRIGYSRMSVIESNFQDDKLARGKVYFLNAQKLGKNSKLVRGGVGEGDEMLVAPDLRPRTFWETLRNTIEDADTTLYAFLDEAHHGMKAPTSAEASARSTIVKQLINGEAGAPAVPIVLGISATVQRFKAAMESAANRVTLPDVVVDNELVRDSGLLKDTIKVSFPAEVGEFGTVLLREGIARTRAASDLWADYHRVQGEPGGPVTPLLVVQVPNKPTQAMLADALATVLEAWPSLSCDNVAHVFGDHAPIVVGDYEIAYVPPEDVAERDHIRVLFAKDAISTGWDCPRAEVLVSYRPAVDETHITQLLGRMVRTPLARRIAGDDRLNAVDCLLPYFDRAAATRVAERLMGDGGDVPIGPEVAFDPWTYSINPELPDALWLAFDELPTETLPGRAAKPTSRLTALGAELARDGLVSDGHSAAVRELVNCLKGQAAMREEEVEAQIADLYEASLETVAYGRDGSVTSESLTRRTDDRALDADFKAAQRVLGKPLAMAYADELEKRFRDGYVEAYVRTAALARLEGIEAAIDEFAASKFAAWVQDHRRAISVLPESRRHAYKELQGLGGVPEAGPVERPSARIESRTQRDGTSCETRPKHLLVDDEGQFPIGSLNAWERAVLDAEIGSCLAWYRNPSRGSADALSIAYEQGGQWRRLCPDLVFFHEVDGVIRPSIVDPHGTYLVDAVPKIAALARYAEQHHEVYLRIEAVADIDGELLTLELHEPDLRDAVVAATRTAVDATEIYRALGRSYE